MVRRRDRGEALRMLRIVEDLMSLSRIEADRFNAHVELVNIGEVARIAIEHAATQARTAADARSSADIGHRTFLPCLAISAQLLQLADNLIGNALRYGCNDKSLRRGSRCA